MNLKWVGVGVAAVAIVGGGAYMLGARTASEPVPVASAPQTAAPTALPGGVQLMPNAADSSGGPSVGGSRFTHFRVGNRNVKGMVADGDFMWVGTSGGVVRYNTKTDDYQLFNVDSGSLLANGVFHVSKLGNQIAVGTYGGGLSLYDPEFESWTNYNIPHGLADQFVYDLLTLDNGDVWIATWSGANRVRGGRFDDPKAWDTFTVANTKGGLPNDWVYGLEKGKDGEIWLGTEGGLARFKDEKWMNWNHDKGLGAPLALVKDDIKFTSDPGKASKHHARQKTEQGLEGVDIAYNPNYIISLAVGPDGTVWSGTWGGGLAHFDGKSWRNYTVKDGLPANHIFMLHVDNAGVLWVGTNHGLARFNGEGKGFSVKTTADGLYSDNVFSMARSTDGAVWVGSFGGVARLENF